MRARLHLLPEGIAPFVVAGLLFGLLYNTLFYPKTSVEYAEAATIGMVLGFFVGIVEQQPVLKRWIQRRSFIQAITLRTLVYSIAVALTLSIILSIEPASLGECTYTRCLLDYLRGPLFERDLPATTAFVFLASFSAHVVSLIGPRNFGRLLIGRYRRPREIRAEFMFADLRGSTSLAESFGDYRYSSMLSDFFTDISTAIRQSRGEVYQYVGDEVIIVWPGHRAAGYWLECFHAMRAAIEAERAKYVRTYGVVPEFKAGVHAGAVVVTEVGTIQRAHVYHGDVLNTAARIQAHCNETGFDLLASGEAIASLPAPDRAAFEPLAPMPLRGKSEHVEVFGLTESRAHSV